MNPVRILLPPSGGGTGDGGPPWGAGCSVAPSLHLEQAQVQVLGM